MATNKYTTEQQLKAFWDKVKVTTDNSCWIWQASPNKRYGYIRWGEDRKYQAAHRVSWMLAFGEILDGLQVLHSCDTPKCVNPTHLFLGTQLDNIKDMMDKNRDAPHDGENNPHRKLNNKQVIEIRKRYANEKISQEKLGYEYGVAQTTVSEIVRYVRWNKNESITLNN